jgi:hypothetical protein
VDLLVSLGEGSNMIIIWFIVAVLCFSIAISGVNDTTTANKTQYRNGRQMSSSTYCSMRFRRSAKRRMRRW